MDAAHRKVIGCLQLGQRIRDLRTASSARLIDVSTQARISVSSLSDIERGRFLPSLEVLDAVASALGTSVCELLANLYPWDTDVMPEHVLPAMHERTWPPSCYERRSRSH